MPLPPPAARRELAHTRTIEFQAYKREDALWDIEARLTDIKTGECHLASGVRPAGEPVHLKWIRLTVDPDFNVVDVAVASDAVPYQGYCETIAPEYRQLVGLNLLRGFRKEVLKRFAEVQGCTHLNELLAQFPTATIQAFAGEQRDTDDTRGKPFQLDRCHALDTRGEGVQRYYPRWYAGRRTGTD